MPDKDPVKKQRISIPEAAEQGNVFAQNVMGLMSKGEKAIQWLGKAAEQGSAEAQYNLGKIYYKGAEVDKNISESFKWTLKAAENGLAVAQHDIGVYYERGEGVEKNLIEAEKWFCKAAEQGLAVSQCALGKFYDSGKGGTKDQVQAINWYLKAAMQGNVLAQFSLGMMYDGGEGVARNLKEAEKWLLKAAEQGYAEAQFQVGAMYAIQDKESQQNSEEVMKWLNIAAKNGHPLAQKIVNEYESAINSSQLNKEIMISLLNKIIDRPPSSTNNLKATFLDRLGGWRWIATRLPFLMLTWGIFVALDIGCSFYDSTKGSIFLILKLIVCAASAAFGITSYQEKRVGWAFVFGIIGIMFNPVLQLRFEEGSWSTWAGVNVITIVIFVLFLRLHRKISS